MHAYSMYSAGRYAVTVFNGSASVTSAPATLEVNVPPSAGTPPPTPPAVSPSQTLRVGDRFEITATADLRFGIVTYQWFKDGVPIPGALESMPSGETNAVT